MNKRVLLGLVVILNAALLVAIVLRTTGPRAAFAGQELSLASNYMLVSGRMQDNYDALYMIDTTTKKLYVFSFQRGRNELELIAGRDLERDFRNRGD